MLMEMAVSRRCGEEKNTCFFDKSNAANLPRSGDNCRGYAYLFSVECVCVLSVFLSVCLFVCLSNPRDYPVDYSLENK